MIIAHIVVSMRTGGIEAMLVDEMNHFSRMGHEIHLVIINNLEDKVLISNISENVLVHRIGRHIKSRNPLYFLKLFRLIRRVDADLIICHYPGACRCIPKRYKRILRVHNTGLNYPMQLSYFDRVLVISESVKRDVETRLGYSLSRVVYNGIPVRMFAIKEDWTLSNFRIVQIGRLTRQKGQDILLRSVVLCRDRFGLEDIRLDFIGDGKDRTVLEELATKLNVQENVRFLGWKSREYLYRHLKDYDLLVQPSRWEGFGLTVAEAMAAKVPVLVSNLEGPLEIIDHGRYGWVFEPENHEACAKEIINIHNDYNGEAFLSKVELAYERAVNNYDINVMVKKLEQQYRDLVIKATDLCNDQRK